MKQSSDTIELSKALFAAKQDFKKLKKDSTANRGSFASTAAMYDSIDEALIKHQIGVEDGFTKEFNCNGELFDFYTLTLIHITSGQYKTHEVPIIRMNNDEPNQGWNGGVTYKRRKVLNTIMGLVEDEDTEEESNNQKPKTKNLQADPNLITTGQLSYLKKLLANKPAKHDDLLLTYGELKEIPKKEASELITELK